MWLAQTFSEFEIGPARANRSLNFGLADSASNILSMTDFIVSIALPLVLPS